jgi:ribosome-associated protein
MASKKKSTKTVASKKTAKTVKKTAKKTAKKTVKKTAKKAAPSTARTGAKKKTAKKAVKKTAKKATKKAAKKTAKVTQAKPKTGKKPAKATAKKASPASQLAHLPLPAARTVVSAAALLNTYRSPPKSTDAAVTVVPQAPTKKPPKKFVAGDATEDFAQAAAAAAIAKKAEAVTILRVTEVTTFADYFVIAHAPSERQVQAISGNVEQELKDCFGRAPMNVDGRDQGNWIVVDYGSVVVHVFLQQARAYYDLDGFWQEAPRVDVDEERGLGALAHARALQPKDSDSQGA